MVVVAVLVGIVSAVCMQWWGSKEPAFIHKRAKDLDVYLRTLCACKVRVLGSRWCVALHNVSTRAQHPDVAAANQDLGEPANYVFVREFIAPAELGDEYRVIAQVPQLEGKA